MYDLFNLLTWLGRESYVGQINKYVGQITQINKSDNLHSVSQSLQITPSAYASRQSVVFSGEVVFPSVCVIFSIY